MNTGSTQAARVLFPVREPNVTEVEILVFK